MEICWLAGYFIVGLLQSCIDANTLVTRSVQRGEDIILPCRLADGMDPEKVSVRWKSSREAYLTSGSRVLKYVSQIEVVKTSTIEWNLRIKSVTDTFAANYTCMADQKVLLSNVQLLILVAPKIDYGSTSSPEVSVDEGGSVELTCAFTGEPVPRITWLRGDKKQATGITGRKLVLRDVKRYATDVYTCRGENSVRDEEYAINLTVKFPVEVEVMDKTIEVATGGMFTLSCFAQGEPLHETYWIDKSGTKVTATMWRYKFDLEPVGAHVPAKFVTLGTTYNLTASDFGTYTCVAEGEGPDARAIVEVVELKDSKANPKNENVIKYN
ncbi:opioid-binding protein/cell adhesion molecule-like isoform X1 [Mya arenaria]|uniref:opioid-binding protein/cell adhesion molecule-like isoform X1 n=1 Tax=Mya arenaria TaxID=6604 RepID=UPI0022E18566|nr:opioid-binding protein/cell adhesion molecule-like isoform X1 [Mya arenaria]